MFKRIFLVCCVTVGLQCAAQTAAPAAPAPLPQDPRALLELARPHYDFNDPAMKPWHLKASYQLYDERGNPSGTGTFEYWWASPKVHRSSWSRANAAQSEWSTADGRRMEQSSGTRLHYFETKIEEELFQPLGMWAQRPAGEVRLEAASRKGGNTTYPCVTVNPLQPGAAKATFAGAASTYCFDTKLPVLRARNSSTVITSTYNSIKLFQQKYLPHDVMVVAGDRTLFTAHVETAEGLLPNDAALTPAADAVEKSRTAPHEAGKRDDVAVGWLISKQQPVYPMISKTKREQGVVVLAATIDKAGAVRNLEVLYAPSKPLADASMDAVAQWKYKPYLLNGEPVEVETTINVIFSLGG